VPGKHSSETIIGGGRKGGAGATCGFRGAGFDFSSAAANLSLQPPSRRLSLLSF